MFCNWLVWLTICQFLLAHGACSATHWNLSRPSDIQAWQELNMNSVLPWHAVVDFLTNRSFQWNTTNSLPEEGSQFRGIELDFNSHFQPLTPGMHGYSMLRPTLNQTYFYELFDSCHKFRVPLEGLHTETGPGVFEVALEFGGADPLWLLVIFTNRGCRNGRSGYAL